MAFRIEYDLKDWEPGQAVKVVPWMQTRYPVACGTLGRIQEIRGVVAKVRFSDGKREDVDAEVDLAHLEKVFEPEQVRTYEPERTVQ